MFVYILRPGKTTNFKTQLFRLVSKKILITLVGSDIISITGKNNIFDNILPPCSKSGLLEKYPSFSNEDIYIYMYIYIILHH